MTGREGLRIIARPARNRCTRSPRARLDMTLTSRFGHGSLEPGDAPAAGAPRGIDTSPLPGRRAQTQLVRPVPDLIRRERGPAGEGGERWHRSAAAALLPLAIFLPILALARGKPPMRALDARPAGLVPLDETSRSGSACFPPRSFVRRVGTPVTSSATGSRRSPRPPRRARSRRSAGRGASRGRPESRSGPVVEIPTA